MTPKPSFKGNSIFIALSKGYTLLISLVSLYILTRYLTTDLYGIYSFSVAIAAVMIGILESGMEHIVVREIAIRKNSSHFFGAAISAKVLILAFFLPIFYFIPIIFNFSEIESKAIYILLVSVSVRNFFFILPRAVFIAFGKLSYDLIYSLIVNTSKIILFIIVIIFDFGFLAVILSILISDIISGLYGFYIVHKKFIPFKPVLDLSAIGYFINQTSQYVISQWFIIAYFNIDIFFIRKFRPLSEIAYFSVPYTLLNSIIYFVVPLLSLYLPRLSVLKEKNDIYGFNQFRDRIYFWLFSLLLPICLGIFIFAHKLPTVIKGYEGSVLPLRIMALVVMLRCFDALNGYILISYKKQKLVNIGQGTSFSINLILDLMLIPTFGVIGASFATLIADLVSFTIMFFKFAKKYLYTKILSLVWKPIVCGILFYFIASKLVDVNMILALTMSFGVYATTLLILKLNDIIKMEL